MKRFALIGMSIVAGIVGLMVLNGVLTSLYLSWHVYPRAQVAPDWSVLGSEEIPSLVTVDEDGERRITQVWIAVVDGVAYLRTGDSRWFENLERDPHLDLRLSGLTYRCGTRPVEAEGTIETVHQAFYDKYPRRSSMFRLLGVSTPRVLALDCEAPEGMSL